TWYIQQPDSRAPWRPSDDKTQACFPESPTRASGTPSPPLACLELGKPYPDRSGGRATSRWLDPSVRSRIANARSKVDKAFDDADVRGDSSEHPIYSMWIKVYGPFSFLTLRLAR